MRVNKKTVATATSHQLMILTVAEKMMHNTHTSHAKQSVDQEAEEKGPPDYVSIEQKRGTNSNIRQTFRMQTNRKRER